MLFNSYVFIFAFLPVVLFLYFQLERLGNRSFAVGWLVFASLVYYGWWKWQFLLLLFVSILANAIFGKLLCADEAAQKAWRKPVLAMGLAFNLGVLAYFKYANFFVTNLDDWFGSHFGPLDILLPIGVSFITFQKIAFLVDAYQGRVRQFSLLNFSLFVTFFPQLIAGPIVHHGEVLSQFSQTRDAERRSRDIAVGWSIFCIGLFKKVIIADACAVYADAGYALLHAGKPIGFATAWTAVLAYSFQLYYDFSGYSDMAVGLARMFGVRFPANFHSPYKATGIIDFWRRWHISLSRFLRDYLYFPLGGNRHGPPRRYLNLMIVMLLGGLWHGANWTFVIWGGIHGLLLGVNHAWNSTRMSRAWVFNTGAAKCGFVVLTFLVVTLAWVPFRSNTLHEAWQMWLTIFLVPASGAEFVNLIREIAGVRRFWQTDAGLLLVVVAAGTWLLPNSNQIFARFEPVTNLSRGQLHGIWALKALDWKVASVLAAMFVACVLSLSRVSPFLYFQF